MFNALRIYDNILNAILFSTLFTYIIIEGLLVTVSCFFKIYLKKSWIFYPQYDPSGNSKPSFHLGADILNS